MRAAPSCCERRSRADASHCGLGAAWGQRARPFLVVNHGCLRLHYAETLKAWRERFLAHREEVERLYDARFTRMWEFYLAVSEMTFREGAMMVFQLQLTKRQDVVPMTRDYIVAARVNPTHSFPPRCCR
jgi:hypothetical protein